MKTQLHSKAVWAELSRRARKSPHSISAAVAYFGKDGAKRLPLAKGSRLAVNMSDPCVRAGSTNPAELLKLIEKGVEVFTCEDLHAKVFVIDETAFVGSMNVSDNSEGRLIEAAIGTDVPEVVKACREFVERCCAVAVDARAAKAAMAIYRPPSGPRRTPRNWLFRYPVDEWSAAAVKAHSHAAPLVRSLGGDPDNDCFEWEGRAVPVRSGHELISIYDSTVYLPATVLHVERYRGGQVIYLEKRNGIPLSDITAELGPDRAAALIPGAVGYREATRSKWAELCAAIGSSLTRDGTRTRKHTAR